MQDPSPDREFDEALAQVQAAIQKLEAPRIWDLESLHQMAVASTLSAVDMALVDPGQTRQDKLAARLKALKPDARRVLAATTTNRQISSGPPIKMPLGQAALKRRARRYANWAQDQSRIAP